ncbi:hypothetical protein AX14_011043 [Amanita brunnescens Koide BX004]|nr:hypothetical protein AX14_011043 [Amanita brunnescens Koide BX004]
MIFGAHRQHGFSVKWEPLCCYYQPGQDEGTSVLQGCISLGINLVHTPSSGFTHHLVSSYTATASVAASLLSASQFAKSEWLREIIRLGSSAKDEPGASQLEKDFTLPPLSKYRPSFSPTLQDSHKVFRVWEPNEERLNMLKGYRFFLVNENVKAPGSDIKDLIQRGGGAFEYIDIRSGKSKWHKALVRGAAKDGQNLVLVGDQGSLKMAVDEREWQDLMHEVEIFNLPFISPGALVEAVIDVDTSALNKERASGEELQVSNTLPSMNIESEEPSSLNQPESPPTLPRRLRRRAASSQASAEPMESVQTQQTPSEDSIPRRPRRALTRRVNALEDLLDATNEDPTASEVVPIDFSAPVPVRSTRLKRKREASSEPVESGTLRTSPGPEVKSVKRHKALIDDNNKQQDVNVEEIYSQFNFETSSGNRSQTQSQSNVSGPAQAPAFPILPVVHEEEEETQAGNDNHRGLKRKADTTSDIEMENVATKKRKDAQVVDVVPDTTDKPPSTVETRVNKLDVDAAFLKAIASTKKGKKKEDDFDRDFNNLKISRPELEHQEEEWDVVDDFDNEIGIRGNFMVVLEMDVSTNGNRLQHLPNQVRSEWRGLLNFKKFKKKDTVSSRSKVELVASEENNYGLGPSYWKGGHSQLHGSQTAATQVKSEVQPQIDGKGRRQALIINDSDEESDGIPVPESQRAQGRARGRARNAARPLFLDSDNEKATGGIDQEPDDSDGYASTLKSTARSQKEAPKPAPKTKTKRAPTAVVDDDSDDGAVFQGFKGKKKRR